MMGVCMIGRNGEYKTTIFIYLKKKSMGTVNCVELIRNSSMNTLFENMEEMQKK